MRITHTGRAGRYLGLAVLAALATPGCVRRTLTINTDPQGAEVVLNDEEVGTSPVTIDFTFYGDYEVIARKAGYETLQTHSKLDAPWYQVPPIDTFAEVLMPFTVTDRREMSFAMQPKEPIDRDKLLKDATEARDRTLFRED